MPRREAVRLVVLNAWGKLSNQTANRAGGRREPMDPQEIVNQAEAAYQSGDIDRIMELFDPEAVFYWNGWKKAEGLAAVRKAHEQPFRNRDDHEGYEDSKGPDKTLRAASGDTIAVEWKLTWSFPDGSRHEGYGGEFWKMRDDRLREWHAYYRQYDEDGEPIPHPWDGPKEY